MKNKEIAEIFARMGDILEFKGENLFRVNAYRKASRVIQDLTEDIEKIYAEGKLRQIPGVGEGMAEKIEEYLKTGKMSKYEEVKKGVPDGLADLLAIQSLGPKTLAVAHKELGVKNISDLKKVIEDGSLEKLYGMGKKKVENILRGMQLFTASKERIFLGEALPLVEEIIEELKKRVKVKEICPAGSLRRMKETIGDIDILATGKEGRTIIEQFTKLPQVKSVLASGETKGSVVVEGGIQVDLRVVEENSYGSALQYFTGSKAHNIHLREMAKAKGMKISEYGIFSAKGGSASGGKGEKKIGGKNEVDIYSHLDLPFIPPEIREDSGEIEAGLKDALPSLVEYEKVKGDLHVHSVWSDGSATIEEIARAAKEVGYEYIAICDHSQSVKYAGGLSVERLLKQIEEIKTLNQRLSKGSTSGGKGIQILAGSEVDIKANGSLDFPDEVLAKLDLVIAAIHSGFKQNVTERIIKAMHHPCVNIIAHPTGRLISKREGYEIDFDAILKEAVKTGKVLEINAYFDRLDLNDLNCRKAKEFGVKVSIGTDAHHLGQLWMLKLGVGMARRGWLTEKDVINYLPLAQLRSFLK
ncbi:MAG: DNA polymerase/3'-5' exonuclease PolX [Candidatus Edwardsbacteria bacterium]